MNEHISVMNDYISQIAMIPLVEKDEEKILANKIQQGDIRALEKLITSNLRLVVKIAHGYKGFGLPFGDLISEGNIGLNAGSEKVLILQRVQILAPIHHGGLSKQSEMPCHCKKEPFGFPLRRAEK